MPRNWRCANGHTWTGDLGVLLACPQCNTSDVYEYRARGQADTAQRPPGAGPDKVPVPPASARSPLDSTAVQMTALPDAAAPPKPKPPAPPPPKRPPPPPPPSPARFKETDIFPAVRPPADADPAEESTVDLPPAAADGTVQLDGTPPPADAATGPSADDWIEPSKPSDTTDVYPLKPADDTGAWVKPPAAATVAGDGDGTSTDEYATIVAADDANSTGDFTTVAGSDDPNSTGDFTAIVNVNSTSEFTLLEPDARQNLPDTAVVAPPSEVKFGMRGRAAGDAYGDTDGRAATGPTTPRAKQNSFRVPEVEGYEILGVLGRGGMGVVYKARQKGLQRLVALKMILGGVHAGAADKGRFRLEAEAVAQLQHPNIVAIYDVGEREGLPFFSLEFLDGGSLQDRAGGQPLTPRAAAEVVAQLADAMQYAHERGIVHRDLKPQNVLFKKAPEGGRTGVTSAGDNRPAGDVPKITDFGLAKKIEDDSGFTGTGAVLGTPSFMSPEQADGRTKEIGPPTDIHALGAILYDLLTGRPPFLGSDPMDTIQQVRNLDPVPPTRWNPRTPLDLENIALKCLQKEIPKRYATAGELADDLRRFLAGEPVLARPTPPWEKAYKWARRRPTAAAVVGLSTLLVASLTGGGLWVARVQQLRADEQEQRADAEARARRHADELKGVAEHQRGRAEGNLKKMRYALDELLTRFGDRTLRDVPAATKIRGELLDRAAAIYEDAVKAESDPNLWREAGWAQQRAGRLREVLGEPKEAAEAYRKAAAMFERLAAQGGEPDDRKNLADTHRQLMTVSAGLNHEADSDKSFEAARDLLGGLTQEFPKDDAYRLELAALWNSRGTVLGGRGQAAEAEAAFAKALDVFGMMTSPDAALEAARTRLNLGQMLATTGNADKAVEELRAARARLGELLARAPDDQRYAYELARSANAGGFALWQARRYDAAEEMYAAAAGGFAALSAKFPTNLDYRFEHAKQRRNLARLLGDRGKPAAAAEREAARGLLRELTDLRPANAEYRMYYGSALVDRAADLEAAGQRPDALAAAAEAIDVLGKLSAADPSDADVLLRLARAKANLGKLLARDAQPAKAEPPVDEAVVLFQAALKRGGSPDVLRELGSVYADQAALKKELGKPRDASVALTSALFTLERYAAQTPDRPDGSAEAARLSAQIAQDAAAQPAAALRYWRRAVTSQREAARRAAARPLPGADYTADYGQYGRSLVDALVGEGDAAGAAKAAGELADLPAKWPGWTDLAALLGRAANRAGGEAKAACCREALACLKRASAGGTLDRARLRESPDFAALRDAPEFKELVGR